MAYEFMSFIIIFLIKITRGWEKNFWVSFLMTVNDKMNMIERRWRRGKRKKRSGAFSSSVNGSMFIS
jgi:hypothetical protein